MNERKHDGPYWMRAHRDWRVWVGVILMLIAMITYLMSEDLSVRPTQAPAPLTIPVSK